MMKVFTKIDEDVNYFAKSSFLDIWLGSEYNSGYPEKSEKLRKFHYKHWV